MKKQMRILIITTLIFISQTECFSQGGTSFQIFYGNDVENGNKRVIFKALTTFEHQTGYSHLGVVAEKFKLGEHNAWGVFFQAGYSFTNFIIPIEITPIISIGRMHFDGAHPFRVLMGAEIGYEITNNIMAGLSLTRARENYTNDGQIWYNPYIHTVSFGVTVDL